MCTRYLSVDVGSYLKQKKHITNNASHFCWIKIKITKPITIYEIFLMLELVNIKDMKHVNISRTT